jgi:hypothetical protein
VSAGARHLVGPAVVWIALTGGAPLGAQTTDPFVMPPPGRVPPAQVVPGRPMITIEMLASQGFEVKAVERSTSAGAGYLVVLQRSGEIRTCLLRLSFDANRNPRRDSFCF